MKCSTNVKVVYTIEAISDGVDHSDPWQFKNVLVGWVISGSNF